MKMTEAEVPPLKRANPFNKPSETEDLERIIHNDFDIFQEKSNQNGGEVIPVIKCGTANMASAANPTLQEGGSLFNRLLRPMTPNEATRTQMVTTRPRLVLRDVDVDPNDDDCDLLSPDDVTFMPRDSSSEDSSPDSKAGRQHCHLPLPLSHEKTKAKIQLVVTSILCFIFMLGEIAGGIVANSLALQTDAAHLASDLIAFLVSLFAIWASGKPATKRMSFGFHRIEVLGALLSIVMIWILTVVLVFMAVQRVINRDYDIDADAMIITAGCGVAFNVIMCGVLHADFCFSEMGSLIKHGHSHDGSHGHSHGGDHGHSHGGDDKGHSHGNDDRCHSPVSDDAQSREPRSASRGDRQWCWTLSNRERDVGHASYHELEDESDVENHVGSPSNTRSPRFVQDPPDLVGNLPHHSPPTHHSTPPHHTNAAAENGVNASSVIVDPSANPLDPQVPKKFLEKKNINVRAAIIHVIGDLIQSIGVLIAAYVIKYKPNDSYLIADPICTFIFSILVLGSTVNVFRDVLTVLMEATPKDVDYNNLKLDLENVPGVKTAHSLHVWSLTLDKYALAVHLGVTTSEKQGVLEQASLMLQQKYQIHHTTIQVEDFVADTMNSCTRCIGPQK